jgi:long-chain acyl-CoA synthetase
VEPDISPSSRGAAYPFNHAVGEPVPIDSIPARLFQQAKNRPDQDAYFVRQDGDWIPTNWATYVAEVRQCARGLIALGVQPGGTVCILGFNRPEWLLTDVATMAVGGAPAGIYTTCSPNEVQYIIDHAEASVVVLEDASQWAKVNAERERIPKLKHVIMMRGAETIEDPMVMTWEAFLARAEEVDDAEVDVRMEALEDDQVATLIYTSGTTGPPKAVMLSVKNLAWTAQAAIDLTTLNASDCSLSYLPLSHIAEQMFTIHGPITGGSRVYFAESIDALPENLREVQPTIVFGVPRIWEKFHAKVSPKVESATGVKAKLLGWAQAVGREANDVKNAGGSVSGLLALKYKLANKLIYSKLKPLLGLGNARVCVSGAAPIAAEILEFFSGLDVVIHEVYGQSEDSGPTTFNVQGATRYGTVGPVIAGVEVKIAEDEEICVRGPNVFLGYYKDEEATNATLIDGWLHSGDLGKFEDGFLRIIGRKKEIIITAGGKNIAPKNIEAALKNQGIISEAVIIGDRRKFLSALLTLDEDALGRLAEAKGLSGDGLHAHAEVLAEVQRGVDAVNELFARVEHVRKFEVLPRNFSVDDGELTPTLKIKRRIIYQNYADVIEGMYAE